MHRIDGHPCCGIYYVPVGTTTPQSLPLLNFTTEITLTPTYSRTVLKQHFKNPSPKEAISEANYVFPLHTTQTITAFTCHVGEDKVLNGIVQSKPKAKATYDAAISRGETAGLLSFVDSDVWQTKLGNIPEGASIEVIITCIAQLQHDSEKDAIRFNLPTYIASRYGSPPKEIYENTTVKYSYWPCRGRIGWWTIVKGGKEVEIQGGMNIKVFVEMDAPIKMVEAPAHATNLSMGTHSASDSSDDFDPKKALLTLSSDTTALDKDFVVLVKTSRSGHPSAVVQRHPTKDTASLMLTLVPKFNMPIARPEVVFICDRSGSMGGNETQLRKALAVFLQSLPVGCKFNICSFGSSHSFLWEKSKTYSEETLKEAQNHVSRFEANMGGTEMFPPVKDAVERRYKDLNLELLLLTDGDIWQRDQLMDYVREQCKAKTIRMFTLGIGNGISHALIDGLASVGGGYSQVVQLDEKLDSKVVRMLRAALGEHVSDYTLEFSEPAAAAPNEDDWDMVGDAEPEKMVISGKEEEEPKPEPKKISLFDTSADLDPPPEYESKDSDEARWAHLPPLPKLPAKIQSPFVIPPLFSFSRTNAYVVFSPCPKTFPKTAKLQAKTLKGDILELEIPVLKVEDGKDVSQLAARSFLKELEDGKGYLHEGSLEAQEITKEKQESKWDEIIEREGVRWGEGFGVASKWTSFVAIEDKPGKEKAAEKESEAPELLREMERAEGGGGYSRSRVAGMLGGSVGGLPPPPPPLSARLRDASAQSRPRRSLLSSHRSPPVPPPPSGAFGRGFAGGPPPQSSPMPMLASGPPPPPPMATRLAAAAPPPPPPPPSMAGFSGGPPPSPVPGSSMAPQSFMNIATESLLTSRERLGRSAPRAAAPMAYSMSAEPTLGAAPPPQPTGSAMFAPAMLMRKSKRSSPAGSDDEFSRVSAPAKAPISVGTAEERIHGLIMLQSFAGSFAISDDLGKVIEASFKTAGGADAILTKLRELATTLGVKEEIVATWAAILVFEKGEGHGSERDTWELVVEKAVMWVEGEGSGEDVKEKVAGALGV